MANPYLPSWEYIPDGEPRVFGDRVYVYGSHDRPNSLEFCDYVLKVWSAPLSNLNEWTCHGVCFSTRDTHDRKADTPWSDNLLYAPDVVEKEGKYYLYAYINFAKGCVAVSDRPEGPFNLISTYKYNIDEHPDGGVFVDPGVLVDDDGRSYIYCGFMRSYMAELEDDMVTIKDGTLQMDVIGCDPENEDCFFEASSPRKIGDTYYFIFCPNRASRLAYATSKSPTGPFEYRGTIIDNGVDYPEGNNHGSICNINGKWYIFYHRMTNNTIMSRRACVERIEILPDGTIEQVDMTSLGFEEYLNPYKVTEADSACVLKGGCYITENGFFDRYITNITDGCVMGWKYFEFGNDYSSSTMQIKLEVKPMGSKGLLHVFIDSEDGEKIGTIPFEADSSVITARLKAVTGRHAIFFKAEKGYSGCFSKGFESRVLLGIKKFAFVK